MVPDCLGDLQCYALGNANKSAYNPQWISPIWSKIGSENSGCMASDSSRNLSQQMSSDKVKSSSLLHSNFLFFDPSPVHSGGSSTSLNSLLRHKEKSPMYESKHHPYPVKVVQIRDPSHPPRFNVLESDLPKAIMVSRRDKTLSRMENHHLDEESPNKKEQHNSSPLFRPFVCQKPSEYYTSPRHVDISPRKLISMRNATKAPFLWKKSLVQQSISMKCSPVRHRLSCRNHTIPKINDEIVAHPLYHFNKRPEKFRSETVKKSLLCEETNGAYETPLAGTPSTVMTSASSCRPRYIHKGSASPKHGAESRPNVTFNDAHYKGPECTPILTNRRLYNTEGPLSFSSPPMEGARHARAELRAWATPEEVIISQNSSQRKVYRGVWLCAEYPNIAFPVAIKFVEDGNARDGRSVKREIECYLFIHQKLTFLQKEEGCRRVEDAWPSAELLGYHLNKKNPGRCTLITRKLSGPDFFDIIRQEHSRGSQYSSLYQYYKLYWCFLAMKRVQQYARLGLRHNDVKPDNIVLDFYVTSMGKRALDVKIIDLGTASMQGAKEFTGGTSWYESPEQTMLEYYSKKRRNSEAAKNVNIGLPSDVWAAGLTITEVLVGRRVVDVMKQPYGPGPLNYRGVEEGWCVDPYEWVEQVRHLLLQTPRDNNVNRMYALEAARFIFDRLVRPDPNKRGTLQDAIAKLKEEAGKALEHYYRSPPSVSFTQCSPEALLNISGQSVYQTDTFCSTAPTARASRCVVGAHGKTNRNRNMCHHITTSNLSEFSS